MEGLAREIPERDLDAALREDGEAAPPVQEQRALDLLHEPLDLGGILTEEQRREALLDDAHDGQRRAVREALAEPGQPVVGRDLHDDLLGHSVEPRRVRPHRPERNGQWVGADAGDLHDSRDSFRRVSAL